MGYPKIKKGIADPIVFKDIVSELTCKYCGQTFNKYNKLRGHLGQCKKRNLFLRQVDRGFIVIVHRTYFYIRPKSRMALKHIETLRKKYQERNGQPNLWERDIQTFIGALTVLELEKKLVFEIVDKNKAIQLAHSVEVVMTDGSVSETDTMAADPPPPGDIDTPPGPEPKREVKALVEVIREKKLKGLKKENDN